MNNEEDEFTMIKEIYLGTNKDKLTIIVSSNDNDMLLNWNLD